MNRIVSVSVSSRKGLRGDGLNGLFFDQNLTGCDLFVGANNAGKTTRELAVAALLSGLASVPTDPRRPFVGPLPANTEVSAVVQTPVGTRRVSRPLDSPRSNETKEAEGEIRQVLGVPVCSMDLRDFASSTAGERGKLLDAVARAGGAIRVWSVADAQARVRAILTLADPDDDESDPTGASTDELDSCIRAISTADTGADWLTHAGTWASARQTETNAAQKASAAHYSELSTTRATPLPDADKDAAREEGLRRELVRLDDAETTRARQVEALARHNAEGERYRKNLADILAEGKRASTPEPKPSEEIPAVLLSRLEQAKKDMDAPIPAPGLDLEALARAVSEAETAHKTATEASKAAKSAHKKAADAVTASQDAQDVARRAEDEARRHHRSILVPEPAEYGTCRYCHADDPLDLGAKRTAALQEQAAALATLDAAIDATTRADDARKTAERSESVARKAMNDADYDTERARIGLDSARLTLTRGQTHAASYEPSVRAARQQTLTRCEEDIEREKARIASDVAAWQAREGRRKGDHLAAQGRWKTAKATLATWEASEAPNVPETTDVTTRRATISAELVEIRKRATQRMQAKATNERIENAARVATESRETWEEVKVLVRAIARARDDMASAAYRPIEFAARGLLAGVPDMPVPYFRGPDDYGADVPGTGRTPFHGLGQSARLLVGAAFVFSLAVVSRQPCPVVLLDGLEVLQPAAARVSLLAALGRAAKEGKVGNVLVTQSGDGDGPVEGVTVHVVTRAPRVVALDDAVVKEVNREPKKGSEEQLLQILDEAEADDDSVPF